MRPRLADTELADAFRAGRNEERQRIARAEAVGDMSRQGLLERMRLFEDEMQVLSLRMERLRGRLMIDNEWLVSHPEGTP